MRMDVDKHPTFQESNELRETIMNKLVLKNIYFLKILKKLDVFVYKFTWKGWGPGKPPKEAKGNLIKMKDFGRLMLVLKLLVFFANVCPPHKK